MPGYKNPAGSLWALNELVGIKAPGLCLSDKLLTSQVIFELNEISGHLSTLTLCRPDAFRPEPLQDAKGGGGAGGGLPAGTIIF